MRIAQAFHSADKEDMFGHVLARNDEHRDSNSTNCVAEGGVLNEKTEVARVAF